MVVTSRVQGVRLLGEGSKDWTTIRERGRRNALHGLSAWAVAHTIGIANSILKYHP